MADTFDETAQRLRHLAQLRGWECAELLSYQDGRVVIRGVCHSGEVEWAQANTVDRRYRTPGAAAKWLVDELSDDEEVE